MLEGKKDLWLFILSVSFVLVWFHGRLSSLESLELDQPVLKREKRKVDPTHVEFVNPKTKEEILENEAGSESDWVWLTSYQRIPLVALQDFCKGTKEYCPPGASGPPGNAGKPGVKGDRGDNGVRGDTGIRGLQGPPGLPGLRGPKGEPGIPGLPGTDGRDGLPGEPGLDGIPGRNGLDGIPGIDGIPGMDGKGGVNGSNGVDGIPGSQGLQGPPGPMGPRGLPGPKGQTGTSGTPGTPGIPGITAWSINNTEKVLIPPSIVGSPGAPTRPMVVNEGENVRIRCTTAGVPRPTIKWSRLDGNLIHLGSWKVSSVEGGVLNITRANREHMGEYVCVADNGVTPNVQRSFSVQVNFPPLIRIKNQLVGAKIHSWAILQCDTEAFPPSVVYWERSDGQQIEFSDKFQMYTKEDSYKTSMILNITRISHSDLGRYHCISKNELGVTKGDFNLVEVDPNLVTNTGKGIAVYGKPPPDFVDIEDLCPTPPPCPDCPPRIETKCRHGGFALLDMVGWEIQPLGNLSFPANRTQDCILSAVGKPVFNKETEGVGNWMRDIGPNNEKYWMTRMDETRSLFEYYNKTHFTKDISKNYTLPFPFRGNFNAIYNGSFYYVTGTVVPKIIKYDLLTGKSAGDLELKQATFTETLYSTENSYVDLAVDENGLWAIHALPKINNTAIVKIDPDLMELRYGWNVSISHRLAGDMFVICGVLYAVDSVVERETKIRLALDLYRQTLLKVDLPFSNPFRKTSMVSYNPKTKELLTWDKGNLLIYPIKYTDIGYDSHVPTPDPLE